MRSLLARIRSSSLFSLNPAYDCCRNVLFITLLHKLHEKTSQCLSVFVFSNILLSRTNAINNSWCKIILMLPQDYTETTSFKRKAFLGFVSSESCSCRLRKHCVTILALQWNLEVITAELNSVASEPKPNYKSQQLEAPNINLRLDAARSKNWFSSIEDEVHFFSDEQLQKRPSNKCYVTAVIAHCFETNRHLSQLKAKNLVVVID